MGSSGGGSASGRTDFPDYMKAYHGGMLDDNGADHFSISIVDAVNSASAGNSPYFAYTSNQLDPDKLFFATGKTIADAAYAKPFDLLALLANFDFKATVDSHQFTTSNTAWVNSLIAAQTTMLDDEIAINVTPKLHASMRDIGAALSSAFVIADTIVQDSKLKALAKTRIDIETLAMQREELALKITASEYQFKQSVVTTAADLTKYYHTIRAEGQDTNAEWLAKDLLWDLKLFQFASNPLGAISGSALSVDNGKGSKAGNAIGGAMAGAAMGAYVGSVVPGIGTAIGAVAGGVIGLAGGIL